MLGAKQACKANQLKVSWKYQQGGWQTCCQSLDGRKSGVIGRRRHTMEKGMVGRYVVPCLGERAGGCNISQEIAEPTNGLIAGPLKGIRRRRRLGREDEEGGVAAMHGMHGQGAD